MSRRNVYGNDWSENGWPMVDQGSCEWITVPGTNPPVSLQIQSGWPVSILRAFVADWNAYIEHVRDDDSACWTPTNSVATSNHLSGTAVDVCWRDHPFQVSYAGFSDAQIATMREMLSFYEDTVWWGQDWTSPKDPMHAQLNGNTFNNPHTQDFINRKIRPDGFSTYRRDGSTAPAPAPSEMTVPLVQRANGRWGSPSPAWDHLIMRESGGDFTVVQHGYVDVNTGGNEAEGGFQITPRTWKAHNGTQFAPSPKLATPQQQAIVAARIFTRNPSGSDWGAGLPGREDAKQLAAGLVPVTGTPTPVQGDDELSAEAERMIRELYDEYKSNRRAPSRSFFAKDQVWGETPLGFQWNMDGNINELYMTWGYLLGVSSIEADVEFVAANGVAPASWAGSLVDESGKRWLSEVGQQWCQGLVALRAAMQKAFRGQPAALAAPEPQVVYVDRQIPATAPPPAPAAVAKVDDGDTGQAIGDLYNVLERLKLADALPIESRAPLAALIAVLNTKNGSQIS